VVFVQVEYLDAVVGELEQLNLFCWGLLHLVILLTMNMLLGAAKYDISLCKRTKRYQDSIFVTASKLPVGTNGYRHVHKLDLANFKQHIRNLLESLLCTDIY
jgi:hypothetical protein